MLACFGSLWPVIPPLFDLRETLDFMMLKWSMSVKVKLPKERLGQPQSMKDKKNEWYQCCLCKTIRRWNQIQVMTLGHSWSLHFMISMRVLNFILGIAGVYISLRMNEINNVKYEWTNEADSMFAKEGPRVEVLYVGPLLEICYATWTIPRSHVYEMHNI